MCYNRGITSHSDKYRQKAIKPGDMLVRVERTRDIYTGGRKGGHSEKVTFELRSKQMGRRHSNCIPVNRPSRWRSLKQWNLAVGHSLTALNLWPESFETSEH